MDKDCRVVNVQDDIVVIEALDRSKGLMKNEVVYIRPAQDEEERDVRLKGEVLRVQGQRADVQVFEDTGGIKVGDGVEQTGEMLSVTLGPGLLGQIYDGLQNPLEQIALQSGFFLPRGLHLPALDRTAKWSFSPRVRMGTSLHAGDTLGTVQEGRFTHRIMVPFDARGEQEVSWIQEGSFAVDVPVARLRDEAGTEREVTLAQRWPVRRPLPQRLLDSNASERLYPDRPLDTTIRVIDTFFPIAIGGTACIPGPFGAGKTVLQNLIARYSTVDIVIIVACGERAGEVVETITEFPQLSDPTTGGSLMDRTVIVCNTSSMPVAAREASIYTGITLGEYYRQMGLDVLLIADSTSRWAQAMRETSGRMEEIPGEEAYPAYLDSAVRSVYERAGVIRNNAGDSGSLTLIGTVSPSGGNFEEPVTQATLSTVKAFLGLSSERAYKRFYPAVDPLLSWSRYRAELEPAIAERLGAEWPDRIDKLLQLLHDGEDVNQMMQVTGDEGITLEDFLTYHKAGFLDLVYLQQDAFDDVDGSSSAERQRRSLALIYPLVDAAYAFEDKDAIRDYFTALSSEVKNLNYATLDSSEYRRHYREIERLTRQAGIESATLPENSD
ncbi:V/A-type H+-transporting ATPase subunit A [Modicisalibacter ilicicola DSM 19980]|uniref:V-type ATP synthase alpha chain n=1 Tax=Modicisalibacter ilicicola DSM 19980 TaxID=1121942 RepID=A0A1M4SL04_9GAMM|nr:V-type ATP synthase subunit A [Halomonas ilicicola]SHE32886.1 V/A-type H+-transporting ATPase subunit A [Halomonas ilicicola DSM 19980]